MSSVFEEDTDYDRSDGRICDPVATTLEPLKAEGGKVGIWTRCRQPGAVSIEDDQARFRERMSEVAESLRSFSLDIEAL